MTWTPGRIRDLWRESGLTQREFAAEYGLALATFKQHLNGRYPPDIHSRRRYAACEAVLAGGLPPSHSCPVCCSLVKDVLRTMHSRLPGSLLELQKR